MACNNRKYLKKIAVSAVGVVVIVLFSFNANAGKNGLGMGVILGEPTGISIKGWNSYSSAIDGAVAWSLEGNDKVHIHADYLFHDFSVVDVKKGQLPFYYGIGARVLFRNEGNLDDKFGVRIPVGLSYLFANSPLEFFIETVPILDLTPDTELDFNGGIGLRFYIGHDSRRDK